MYGSFIFVSPENRTSAKQDSCREYKIFFKGKYSFATKICKMNNILDRKLLEKLGNFSGFILFDPQIFSSCLPNLKFTRIIDVIGKQCFDIRIRIDVYN